MKQRTIVLITVGFGLVLLSIILLANAGVLHAPMSCINGIPLADAVIHFFLMGVMALLVNICLRGRRFRLGPLGIMLGSVIVAVVVTAEEFSQLLMERRTFSWVDLGADYLGISALGRFSLLLVRKKASPADETEVEAGSE
jgi:hypothetical protein